MLCKVARNAGRLIDDQHFAAALLFGLLDPPLDVPHGIEILGQLRPVARRQAKLKPLCLLRNRVENAAVAADAGEARGRVGTRGGSKEPLEHRARIGFHRQRCRRAAPRDGVGVRTCVGPVAGAQQLHRFERELERGELRVLRQVLRRNLVGRHACLNVGGGGAFDVHAGQEGGCAPRMIASALAG